MDDVQRILVTGATGFIGNYIIEELVRKNLFVIATSTNEQKAKQLSWFNKVLYIPFDFLNFEHSKNYFDFFQTPDIVIHLAWENLPNYTKSFHTEINLPHHQTLLSNLICNGLKSLTVTGTCLEYGMQEGELSEKSAVEPLNSYALAKNQLRLYLELLQKTEKFSLKWVRPFYISCDGKRPSSIFGQLKDAINKDQKTFNMSSGEQVRDYLPVEKMASYIVQIALQKKEEGIINCCSGSPTKLIDLIHEFLSKNHSLITLNKGYYPYPSYEPVSFWGNTDKLKRVISCF